MPPLPAPPRSSAGRCGGRTGGAPKRRGSPRRTRAASTGSGTPPTIPRRRASKRAARGCPSARCRTRRRAAGRCRLPKTPPTSAKERKTYREFSRLGFCVRIMAVSSKRRSPLYGKTQKKSIKRRARAHIFSKNAAKDRSPSEQKFFAKKVKNFLPICLTIFPKWL